MRSIGLTGGIASGKSTVSKILAERGAVLIDADLLGHQTYEPGSETFAQVVAEFGDEIGDDALAVRLDARLLRLLVPVELQADADEEEDHGHADVDHEQEDQDDEEDEVGWLGWTGLG